jgi:hypothetical protein
VTDAARVTPLCGPTAAIVLSMEHGRLCSN